MHSSLTPSLSVCYKCPVVQHPAPLTTGLAKMLELTVSDSSARSTAVPKGLQLRRAFFLVAAADFPLS